MSDQYKSQKIFIKHLFDSLTQALLRTNNKKTKQQLRLEIYKLAMLEKHNLKQLVEKDFTALAGNVMRAISLDNLFCLKSPSYKAAIETYHLAMETELKPTQTRMSSNHRQSYKNKLNEIVDRLQCLVLHQQSVQPKKSEKHEEMGMLAIEIHNMQINFEYNNNPIRKEKIHSIISDTKQVLGKHLGTVLTQFYKPNSLKVCEPELERLEKELESLDQYYTGRLY